jgi:DNA gyrase subunit A
MKKSKTKSSKSSSTKKTKSKNGFILDNEDIDIQSVTYPTIPLKEEVERRMGIYGYNVNLERATPNVRDGLKPVQRKIIYTGITSGFTHNKPFKKALRYIGEGSKYYVHGDRSYYDALVSLAEDFYTNYPLIEPHGSVGSITGDGAAAPRYLELRLSSFVNDLITDLGKESVDFKPNYDNTEVEPTVLPVNYPLSLINGTFGIGQGLTSSVPPHNFGEIIDKTIALIKNPDMTLKEVIKGLKPDYPTGGIIINKDDLKDLYTKGKSTIRLRGKVEVTPDNNLLITSIPYMKNVNSILDNIQDAIRKGKITGISNIKNNTNAINGVKVTIVVKKGYDPKVIESQLYKFTGLQDGISASFIFTTPDMLSFKVYNVKEILEEFIKFRKVTLYRKFNDKISTISKKIHIDEGLLIALKPVNIDKIIAMIKKSKDANEVKENLIKTYKLTQIQAEYISELRLVQLCNLEIVKIQEDLKVQKANLKDIVEYFEDSNKLDNYIIKQLEDGKKKYGRPRRTEAINVDTSNMTEAIVENTSHTVLITNEGYIKKIPYDKIKTQNTKGIGINVGKMRENDFVINIFNAKNLDEILFFTNQGRVYVLKLYNIKEVNLTTYGLLLSTLLDLKVGEKVIRSLVINKDDYDSETSFLLFATRNGLIKKSLLSLYSSIPKKGFFAIDLNDDDELVNVLSSTEDVDIVVATDSGKINKYSSSEVTLTKRLTKGVKSIVIDNDKEHVVACDYINNNKNTLFVLTSLGNGKRIENSNIKPSERVKAPSTSIRLSPKERVVASFFVTVKDEITIVSNKKIIKIPSSQIPVRVKDVAGDKIMSINKGETVLCANKQ